MTRFSSCIAALVLGGISVSFVSTAGAESPAQIAAKENEDGRALMFERRYKEASAKFRSAANRSPDPKYFFNLCASEYQQYALNRGEAPLIQAMAACRAANKLSPDAVLKAKIDKLEAKIASDAAAQRIDLNPPTAEVTSTGGAGSGPATGSGGANAGGSPDGTGGTNTGTLPGGGPVTSGGTTGGSASGGAGASTGGVPVGPTTPPAAPSGRPPTQDLFVEAKPEHAYTWTVGIDLFGGRASMGQVNAFGDVVGGLRLRSDYLINAKAKFGSQFYVQGTGFGSGDQSLQLYDTGVAFYKHFCGWTRLCLTPLAGAHLTLMSPSNGSASQSSQVFNYLGVGARLEGKLSYSIGKRLEHVISVAFDANWYTRALSEPMNGISARSWGLDQGGDVVSLSFGYTYRFNTPVGRVPFLSLE